MIRAPRQRNMVLKLRQIRALQTERSHFIAEFSEHLRQRNVILSSNCESTSEREMWLFRQIVRARWIEKFGFISER